jgi:conjugal transfer pilus assembly protein TraV
MQRLIPAFILAMVITGCAGTMNPYSSSFQCPEMDRGKCVSVRTAYKESMEKNTEKIGPPQRKTDQKQIRNEQKEKSSDALYQSALYDRLNRLLTRPESPLVVPPQVMRVLILPYTGDERELYMYRYVYIFVDEPRWLLKNLLSEPEEAGK